MLIAVSQIKELQDDVEDSPVQSAEGNGKDSRSAFIFGYSSITNSLHHYHPGTTQSQFLLNIYEERVAPMVMIFHKPSIRKSIYKASTNAEYIDQTSESVVFSIYFAAATSLKPSECLHYLGEEHTTVRQRMRFAVQQALARVEFLTTRNLAVLQAMVLFLTCLRQPEDADFVWTMSAVALRLARGLGLHRDGTQFRLSPFESEMRRRLWWYIYLLDIQICEYHAISSGIDEDSVDTGLPSNIDDAEISPESKEVSSTEARFTEMTFCLARCEMITHNRRLARTSASLPLEQTLQELRKIHTHIQEKYLQYCDVSVPIQWVTATILRLAIARSWLVAHFPRLASDVFPPLDSSTRNQLFRTAVEVTEFACLLETDERTTKWSWLFKGYVQWHAIAFVLSELCNREESSDDLRAWTVVEGAYNRWKERDFRERGIVLKAVTRLMERATRRHGRSMRVAEGCPEHVDWSMDDSNTGVAYMNLFRDFLRNGRT